MPVKEKKVKCRGQKPKLTRPLMAQFCKLLANNHTVKLACQKLAISEASFFRWLEVGAEGERGLYREFLESTTIARATTQTNLVDSIQRQGKKDWRAHAWLLERLAPRQFSMRQFTFDPTTGNPTTAAPASAVTDKTDTDNILSGGFSVNIHIDAAPANPGEPEPKL